MVLFLDIVRRYGVSRPYVRGLVVSTPLMARYRRIALLQSWRDMLSHPCGISVVNMDLPLVRRGSP